MAFFCLIIYFTSFGLWQDFIDYAVVGISTFSNKVGYGALFRSEFMIIRILAAIFLIQIIAMFAIYVLSFKKKEIENKEWFKNIYLLLIYSVVTAVAMLPITDEAHFAVRFNLHYNSLFLLYIHNIIKTNKKTSRNRKHHKKSYKNYSNNINLWNNNLFRNFDI